MLYSLYILNVFYIVKREMENSKEIDENIIVKIRETTNPKCREEFVRFGPGKCFLPVNFSNYMEPILQFQVRKDDIWLASFMKTGTTWLKELVWLLMNDLDFKTARNQVSYSRFPNFESSGTVNILRTPSSNTGPAKPSSIEQLQAETKSPRLIHTHLPWSLLPKEIQNGHGQDFPKIIYITRNPKDVAVSYFHHRVLFEGFLGTMDDFVELFINDAVRYAPFWTHVEEFWKRREKSNILFLTYEQMKKDLSQTVEIVADFLDVKLDPSKKTMLLKYLDFEEMKENPAVNHESLVKRFVNMHGVPKSSSFIRKGKLDSWKDELSENAKEKLEAWIMKNRKQGELSSLWQNLQ